MRVRRPSRPPAPVGAPDAPPRPRRSAPGGAVASADRPAATPRSRRSPGRGATAVAAAAVLLGLTAAPPAGAVVNGTRTPVASAPFAVQVLIDRRSLCTGSLIRPRVVLTAAHCLAGARSVTVVALRQRTRGTTGVRIRAVRRAYDARAYPGRSRSGGTRAPFDVGLLELSRDVPGVTPIALAGPAEAGLLAPGGQVALTGWGLTSSSRQALRSGASTTLRTAIAPIRSSSFCRGKYGDGSRGVVCTGRLRRPVAGACFGDSGGPVYASTPAGLFQVAVISGGPDAPCGVDVTFSALVQSGRGRGWVDRHVTAAGRVRGATALR